MKKLTKREKEFCRVFAVTGDSVTAALKAGYTDPDECGMRLLPRKEIADEIARNAQNVHAAMKAASASGLWRLAFGDHSDAIRLCASSERDVFGSRDLDLFGISEVKATDKGVEMRFFDRVKAIEKLREILGTEDRGASPSGLIEALREGAQSLREEDRNGI